MSWERRGNQIYYYRALRRQGRLVKQYIGRGPAAMAAAICEEFGDVAKHAETALINLITGGETLTSTAITQRAAKMRQDLAGPSPTLLEKLAVARVVATWLQLQDCEMRFLQTQTSVQWARYWLARQSQADRLYRSAVKSLLLVRDLLPRAIQSGTPAHVEAGSQVSRNDRANGTHMARFAVEPPVVADRVHAAVVAFA